MTIGKTQASDRRSSAANPLQELAPPRAENAAAAPEQTLAEPPQRRLLPDPFPIKTVNVDGHKVQLQQKRQANQMEIKFGDGSKKGKPSDAVRDFIKSQKVTVKTERVRKKHNYSTGIVTTKPGACASTAICPPRRGRRLSRCSTTWSSSSPRSVAPVSNGDATHGFSTQPWTSLCHPKSPRATSPSTRFPMERSRLPSGRTTADTARFIPSPVAAATRTARSGKDTHNYGEDDLLHVSKLFDVAYAWIIDRKQADAPYRKAGAEADVASPCPLLRGN